MTCQMCPAARNSAQSIGIEALTSSTVIANKLMNHSATLDDLREGIFSMMID
jgi:hypothetical protein